MELWDLAQNMVRKAFCSSDGLAGTTKEKFGNGRRSWDVVEREEGNKLESPKMEIIAIYLG